MAVHCKEILESSPWRVVSWEDGEPPEASPDMWLWIGTQLHSACPLPRPAAMPSLLLAAPGPWLAAASEQIPQTEAGGADVLFHAPTVPVGMGI